MPHRLLRTHSFASVRAPHALTPHGGACHLSRNSDRDADPILQETGTGNFVSAGPAEDDGSKQPTTTPAPTGVHTSTMGTGTCSKCAETLSLASFSKSQRKKLAKGKRGTCMRCLTVAEATSKPERDSETGAGAPLVEMVTGEKRTAKSQTLEVRLWFGRVGVLCLIGCYGLTHSLVCGLPILSHHVLSTALTQNPHPARLFFLDNPPLRPQTLTLCISLTPGGRGGFP